MFGWCHRIDAAATIDNY